MRSIAAGAGVSRGFLSKIVDWDGATKMKLDIFSVSRLITYISGTSTVNETISSLGDSVLKFVLIASNSAYDNHAGKLIYVRLKDQSLLDDYDIYIILVLASCSNTKIAQIKELIPKFKHHKIELLIKKNIVSIDKFGGIGLVGGDFIYVSTEQVVAHMPRFIEDYFSIENLGKGTSCIYSYMDGVSELGLNKIQSTIQHTVNMIDNIMYEHPGNNPSFVHIAHNTFGVNKKNTE